MKIILILGLFLVANTSAWASSGYDITINNDGYDLKIQLDFTNYQSLSNVRAALVKSAIISQLSPNVKSVTTKGSPEKYESLMVVKSFGIKSELLSKCREELSETSWSRSCVLQTDKLDGGKHMVWKTDEVTCSKKTEQNVQCAFSIKGKTKPLIILGIPLLNERVFSVKVKLEALNNFFKIFYFITDHNTSIRMALDNFSQSKIKSELEAFEKEGSQKLKKENSYRRSYTLPGV